MRIFSGKWRTWGGDVVTVERRLSKTTWLAKSLGLEFEVDGTGRQRLDGEQSEIDLIAPVIEPGSEWVIDGERWFVIGKERSGRWCVQSEDGLTTEFVAESAFHTPYVAPPKPRTVTAYVVLNRVGEAIAFNDPSCAEWVGRDTRFPVVEVTLTEEQKQTISDIAAKLKADQAADEAFLVSNRPSER